MAEVNLLKIELDQPNLKRFTDEFGRKAIKLLKNSLPEIQQEFIAELNRQQQRLSRSGWDAWEKDYAARRVSEYGKPRLTRFKTKLKRTGAMMAGYIQGVVIDEVGLSVTMNYPTGTDAEGYNIGIRAKSHQGIIGQPRRNDLGTVPIRPFQLDKFNALAFKIFERNVREGLKK